MTGLYHRADLKAFPDYQCMLNVFEGADEVDFTAQRSAVGSHKKRYYFSYHEFVTMSIDQMPKGNIVYYHSAMGVIGQKIPQSSVDSVWPIMKSIEAKLEEQCGIALRDNIRVKCTRKLSCPK